MDERPVMNALRRWHLRRLVALIAVLAVFGAALAQAAHVHKNEGLRGAETHLQCQLCMHADRWAGPPELPQQHGAPPVVSSVIAPLTTAAHRLPPAGFYDARGPPLI
jgi:hypothetical protein